MTERELRDRFNPEGSKLRQHQLHLLEMAKKFDAYCREYGIKYTLSSGTTLGAIRHGGFVPWDDDLDMEMTAKEYRRLRKSLKRHPLPGLSWQDWKNEPLYVQPFGKIRDTGTHIHEKDSLDNLYKVNGHYIDIFPLYPSNSLRLAQFSIRLQNTLQYRVQNLPASSRRLLLPVAKMLTHRVIFPMIRILSAPFSKGRLRHTPGTAFTASRHRKYLSETRYVQFEDTSLPVPADTDSYLRSLYGDYMRLPDLDRLPRHLENFDESDK